MKAQHIRILLRTKTTPRPAQSTAHKEDLLFPQNVHNTKLILVLTSSLSCQAFLVVDAPLLLATQILFQSTNSETSRSNHTNLPGAQHILHRANLLQLETCRQQPAGAKHVSHGASDKPNPPATPTKKPAAPPQSPANRSNVQKRRYSPSAEVMPHPVGRQAPSLSPSFPLSG